MTTKEKPVAREIATIAQLRDHVAGAIEVKDGALSVNNDTYYSGVKLSGLNKTDVDDVHTHDTRYAAASVSAVGNHSLKMFTADPSLAEVDAHVAMGVHANKLDIGTKQKRVGRNPATGEETVSYGAVSVTINLPSADIKAAKAEVKAAAAQLLAPKS